MSLATDIKVFHSASTRASNSVLKAHCRYLISTLNKKNLKTVLAEIQQLETQYDPEMLGGLLVNSLIELIDWNDSSKRNKDQTQLLASKISLILSNQPNFSSLVCSAFEGMTLPDDFIATFSGALKLNHVQEITLALGMTKALSENIVAIGTDYICNKCLAALSQGNLNDKFPDYVIHELLFFIREYDDFPEKEDIIEYFRKNYNSVFSLMPLINSQATRNDAKRNWKKESLMRQSSSSQDIENSIALSELVEELDMGNGSKINSSSLIHGSMKTHLMNQIVEKLSSSPIPSKMILQAWSIDCTIVLAAFQESYTRDPSLLPQILELVQELKALRLVLDTCALSNFAIDLAALASLGDFLNLSKWLAEMVEKYGDQFTSKAIAFLKERIIQQQQLPSVISNPGAKPAEQPKFVILTYEAVQIFMELFKAITTEGKMSPVVQEEFQVLQSTLESEIFPSDIEKEANDIFSKIYDGLMSIEEIINLLQLLKVSNNLRERKIFQCIIRSFYEEYPHIPKYPEKELQITGILFGSLIQNQLVSYVPLVIALRYVLEALKQPISTNLFKFGFYALEQFIPRLPEWPQYCAHLRQVTHLQQVHMGLYQHIDAIFVASGMNAQPQQLQPQQLQPQPQQPQIQLQPQIQPQLQPQQAQLQPQQQQVQPQPVVEKAAEPQQEFTGHSLNISTLISTQFKIVEPSEDICDDIHFIFNNLTTGNVELKSKELIQLLKPEYYDYFSFYLVVKRVSLEENYQELYCRLLFTLGLPKVLNQVRKQTTAAIKTLIESGRTKVSTGEKELLLSLASWIGLITIARDIPLRHNHIALKECLLTAFETGSLISIVPFVSRILKLTKKSKWFKPPNPWTVAILRVFAEIHHYPHVVDPIKFEIEILCNVLEIKMDDIVPSDLLKNKVKYAGPGAITDFEPVPEPSKDTSKFSMSYLNINPSIAIFKRQPHLKKAVFLSINNAIRESIQPVIDRLVTIASITTRELVLKDFAMEPDESKMLSAASAMVQSLAGNLATVTCKDNLRLSITNNLRTTLGGPQGKNVPPHIEQAIHTIVQDNIEIACGVVQKVAAEAAVSLMEEQLQEAVQARKTHRERSGRRMQYYDINFVGGHGYSFSSTLPDFLKCNLGGVTPEQLQVYKYFLVSPGTNPNIPPKVGGEYYDSESVGYESIDFKDLQYAEGEKPGFPDDGLGFSGSYIQYPDSQLGVAGNFQGQAVANLSVEQQQQLQHQIHQQQVAHHTQQQTHIHSETIPSTGLIQLSAEQAAKKIDLFVVDLANILTTLNNISSLSELPSDHPVVQMFSLVGSIIMCTPYKNEIIAYTIQIVLPKLFEPSLLHREAFLTVIDVLVNTLASARKYITDLLLRFDNAHKFHHEVVPALLHYTLLSLPDYDANLSQLILENDPAAIEFATYLYQDVIKASVLNPADLVLTLEALKLKVIPTDTALVALIENIRVIQQQAQQAQQTQQTQSLLLYQQQQAQAQHENGASSLIANRKPCTEYVLTPKEVPLAQQQLITRLFSEWVSGVVNEKTFVQHLQQYGLFGVIVKGGNDLELLFYQSIIEIAVNQYLTSVEQDTPDSTPEINCSGIDWLIKLFHLLIQYSPEKPTVVRNILSRIIYCLHNSHAAGTSFDQRPYLRLVIGLLKLFQAADPVFDVQQMLLLLEFRDAFHFLRPAVYPGFVFAWLELVSHRMFMPKILADPQGWPFVAELLIDFFSFVAPWLKEAQMNPAIHLLYQGILRVLLVLLHDFPEFLCDYHYNFCDVIPQTCIQMRNLILSAFPHSMKLPDPFIPNLKLDLLPEIKDPPRIKSDFYSAIQKVGLIAPLDAFIKTGKPATFLPDLIHILKTTGEDESYNVKAINSIVLYIGTRAIAEVAYQRGELSPLVPMEIFRYLTFNFDNEGRYILFNAIANQLRYPNNHTYYFSCVLLFLFAEASQEIIQEQITRILVERLIVHRPHPWGLLVTFVELVKNQRYNFWGRAFTRCAPEIERLFIQVGTHIAQHKGVP